jgi:copper/silver efflux system protein
MIERIIEWSAHHRAAVFTVVLLMCAWSLYSLRHTPLDAIPDLSDPQVIVFTDWMGRSPDLVEDQITYPLVRALQSTPGVRTVRGYSMFGMSFVYVIFADGTDIYWARTRVFEQISQARQWLPDAVTPTLGPDASGVGWIYQYVLKDHNNAHDLAELRALQDFVIRPALQAVPGVAEVASLGGFERQYQLLLDPGRLAAYGINLSEISRAIQGANAEIGARVIEQAGREFIVRGRGYAKSLEDLEQSLVKVDAGGNPVRIGDIGRIQFGPEMRRGAADFNGEGEAVGGIIVMRLDANALSVIQSLKQHIAQLALPDGVELIPTYDRSELILGSIRTLTDTLVKEGLIILAVCLIFLMHVRSALVAVVVLPLSVLFSFIAIRHLGLSSNIMSLGGIAIAMVELADAIIVMIENAHRRLANDSTGEERTRVIIDACKEVGRPVFFSTILLTVSFLPVFTLGGQAGRLFDPLAFTKTFAMLSAAVLTITLAPLLMVLLLKGRIRTEQQNPVARALKSGYRPLAVRIVHHRKVVTLLALLFMVITVPVYQRLGSEFMPPLDEGSLLIMPTTFPGIAIEEARQVLTAQHRVIMSFPEVASVHGKAGRAETATDPAQLDMNESVVLLHPREQWPLHPVTRWYSGHVPEWLLPALRLIWPEQRRLTLATLSAELDAALQTPGYQMAISPPIRTRIDMLTTGVRTPVGIKVFGDDLQEIERLSIELEGLLRTVPGTRSTFAERQTGREYIDIVPRRDIISRYGLTVRDLHDSIELAIGGMPVSTIIDGRARYSVNLRFGADYRSDPEALGEILVPVVATAAVAQPDAGRSGRGSSAATSTGSNVTAMGGMDGMDGMNTASAPMPTAAASMPGMSSGATEIENWADLWRQSGSAVPLGVLADIQIVTGPPMIKNENGMLVGYVFADFDSASRDLGGWVDDARQTVERHFRLPPGYRLEWTGQYEFMADMQARLRIMIPLTLILIIALLYLSLRGWGQTFLVLLSVPFAVTGSVWLLAALHYNLSTAVWVGLIAVGGVATQTAIVVVVYLDQAIRAAWSEQRLQTVSDINAAVVEGAVRGVRPMVMTVATTVLGLLPLLWEEGVGADLSARTAAPVVGGMIGCLLLTLMVLPAVYTLWRQYQFKAGRLDASLSSAHPQATPPLPAKP